MYYINFDKICTLCFIPTLSIKFCYKYSNATNTIYNSFNNLTLHIVILVQKKASCHHFKKGHLFYKWTFYCWNILLFSKIVRYDLLLRGNFWLLAATNSQNTSF